MPWGADSHRCSSHRRAAESGIPANLRHTPLIRNGNEPHRCDRCLGETHFDVHCLASQDLGVNAACIPNPCVLVLMVRSAAVPTYIWCLLGPRDSG